MWPTMWPRHRTTGRDRPPLPRTSTERADPGLCRHPVGLRRGARAELAAEDLERALREKGGHVRRAIQVLGIALMAAGLLLDSSVRSRNRRAGKTSDKNLTSRLPVPLFWIGAVLLVLSSI